MLSQKPRRMCGREAVWLGVAAAVLCALPTLYYSPATAQSPGTAADAADAQRAARRLDRLEKELRSLRQLLQPARPAPVTAPAESDRHGNLVGTTCAEYRVSRQQADALVRLLGAFGGFRNWHYTDAELVDADHGRAVIRARQGTHARIQQLIAVMQDESFGPGDTALRATALRCWLGIAPSWENSATSGEPDRD